MRRIIYIFVVLAAVLSCSRTEVPERVVDVAFSAPVVSAPTRTDMVDDADDMAAGISVFAAKYVSKEQGTMFMNNVKVYKNNGIWDYDGDRYHWSPNAYHQFFSIYPYCGSDSDPLSYYVNTSTRGLEVSGIPLQDGGHERIKTGVSREYDCPDILYGVVIYDKLFDMADDPGRVVFDMKHAGAMVTLNVVNRSDYVITAFSGELKGAPGSTYPGLYDTADKIVFITDSDTPIAWQGLGLGNGKFRFEYTGTGLAVGDKKEKAFQDIVIPQNINKEVVGQKDKLYLHVNVTFKESESLTSTSSYVLCLADIPLSGQRPEDLKTWLSGKNYIYNLNVTSDYITCGVSVVDWIEDEMIDLN